MLTTAKAAIHLSTIAIVTIVANVSAISTYAQSTTADSFNFEELSAGGEGGWNFSSENETVSIKDDLRQLGDYDISGVESFNIRLTPRNRRRLGIGRWANKGDRPYYSLDNRILPFDYRGNIIYD